MTGGRRVEDVLWRWASPVRDFRIGAFRLQRDLHALRVLSGQRVVEAVVFYGGRVLEALAGAAVRGVGLDAPSNPFSCLTTLDELGLLDPVDGYVAHALRRLGNAVRHIGWAPGEDDTEIVLALTHTWLGWYFLRFALGPHLRALGEGGADAAWADESFTTWIEAVRRSSPESADVPSLPAAIAGAPADRLGPGHVALVCVAVETWIGQRRHAEARRLLDQFRVRASDDVRLLQLDGLLSSRLGELDRAISLLEPQRRKRPDDPETTGILAGALKRRAGEDVASEDFARASRLYRDGWRASHEDNAWLGINAASTALLSGDAGRAREVAETVAAHLEERRRALAAAGAGALCWPYWPAVTYAEALLLLGRREEAVEAYADAFRSHAERVDDIGVTKRQADRILAASGERQTLEDLLVREADESA